MNNKNNYNKGDWRYLSVEDQPSDFVRRQIEYGLKCHGLTLYNQLPVNINVILERDTPNTINKYIEEIGEIQARGSKEYKPEFFQRGDLLHFKYVDNLGNYKFACPSSRVSTQLGDIIIGSTVSTQNGWKRDIPPTGDISSLRFHNMLPWPIVISHNGYDVMYLNANTDLGNPKAHGNVIIAPQVYYDNFNTGIKIGDIFEIIVDKTNEKGVGYGKSFNTQNNIKTNNSTNNSNIIGANNKVYFEKLNDFVVNDRNISEIIIGTITTQTDSSSKPETYNYRLGYDDTLPRPANTVSSLQYKNKWRNNTPISRYMGLEKHNMYQL